MSLKKIISEEFLNYLFILTGGFLLAVGMTAFLAPNQIATGGTAGLAIVLHYVSNWPIGVLMAIINIPLLLVSVRVLGKKFALKSIVGILSISFFIDFLNEFVGIPVFSTEPLLATLYGGIAVGLGLGLIFKGGGSAGGGTIIAKLLSSRYHWKTGTIVLVLDAVVVVSAGWVFKSIELALWSMISIFVASKLIDLVLTGRPTQKIVHISSMLNLEALSKTIIEELGVKGTIVKGQDLMIHENKHIIFIVVDRNRINALENLVYSFDPAARMIVMEASEMLGQTGRK